MYNVIKPSDNVHGDNDFKISNNVPSKSSERLSLKSANQLSNDGVHPAETYEECASSSNSTKPSPNARFEKYFI